MNKFCVDCKWYEYKKRLWWDYLMLLRNFDSHTCNNPECGRVNIVTGVRFKRSCESARISPCGAGGKLWEQFTLMARAPA
jgi:hypothetical protein